jgi:hypothetical protein
MQAADDAMYSFISNVPMEFAELSDRGIATCPWQLGLTSPRSGQLAWRIEAGTLNEVWTRARFLQNPDHMRFGTDRKHRS